MFAWHNKTYNNNNALLKSRNVSSRQSIEYASISRSTCVLPCTMLFRSKSTLSLSLFLYLFLYLSFLASSAPVQYISFPNRVGSSELPKCRRVGRVFIIIKPVYWPLNAVYKSMTWSIYRRYYLTQKRSCVFFYYVILYLLLYIW